MSNDQQFVRIVTSTWIDSWPWSQSCTHYLAVTSYASSHRFHHQPEVNTISVLPLDKCKCIFFICPLSICPQSTMVLVWKQLESVINHDLWKSIVVTPLVDFACLLSYRYVIHIVLEPVRFCPNCQHFVAVTPKRYGQRVCQTFVKYTNISKNVRFRA